MPEPDTIAAVTCSEYGRQPAACETFRIYRGDGEAVTYCPACAKLEFAPDAPRSEDRA